MYIIIYKDTRYKTNIIQTVSFILPLWCNKEPFAFLGAPAAGAIRLATVDRRGRAGGLFVVVGDDLLVRPVRQDIHQEELHHQAQIRALRSGGIF